MHSFYFTPLQSSHFPLLYKWMNTDSVAKWWGENLTWSLEDITQKYESYCKGYKRIGGVTKPIYAFMVEVDSQPIGFVQYYNAYDFPREDGVTLPKLSDKLAAIDFYIGEPDFIGKGLGPIILNAFLKEHVKPMFNACFVDPDYANKQAIRAYEKAGFQRIDSSLQGYAVWMVKILD